MPMFRKRPVVIRADQWFKNGDHPEDGPRGEGAVVRYYRHPDKSGEELCKHCDIRMHEHGWIDTLEASHNVCPGDWIIKGVAGERYPCKPNIFDATYEAV